MVPEDVLRAEEHADENDDATEQEDEEVREVQLLNRFVLADDSHNRRLGCDGHVRRIYGHKSNTC